MTLTIAQAQKAHVALQRFGLGAKQSGVVRIGADPVAAVKAELANPSAALISDPSLPSYRRAAATAQLGFSQAHEIYQAELKARIRKHMEPEVGFVERLVLFWSNHFSMSINKNETVRGMIGQLERSVIRQNVLGSFGAMLKGVIQHPAMVSFLDNTESMGPNSKIGKSWGTGLNENLAREILELHTLGSGGGYSEGDVTQLARIITGWSYVRGWEAQYGYNGGTAANVGKFIYRPDWHEPGPVTFMRRVYADTGISQGEAVLGFLTRRRATAQHIAYKLVRHFITDNPTPAMVTPVADAFYNTRGNLKATAMALVDLPEAWSAPLTKIRTPYELEIARFRALNTVYDDNDRWAFTEPLRAMHHLPWERPTPDGYPDESEYWLDPDGMTIRLDTAQMAAWMMRDKLNLAPEALAYKLFNGAMTRATKYKLRPITDRVAGATVLFMSPEFQRR